MKELVWEPSISRYGADEGMPELREALVKKVNIFQRKGCVCKTWNPCE